MANSKECAKRQTLLVKLDKAKKQREEERSSVQFSGRVQSGLSFADAARSSQASTRASAPARKHTPITPSGVVAAQGASAQSQAVDSDCTRFFGMDLMSLITKVGAFKANYNALSAEADKRKAFVDLISSLSV